MCATTVNSIHILKMAFLLALLLWTRSGHSRNLRNTKYLPMKRKPSLTAPETLKLLKEIYNGVELVPQVQSSPPPPPIKQVSKPQVTHTKNFYNYLPSAYNTIPVLQGMDANVVFDAFYPDYYY